MYDLGKEKLSTFRQIESKYLVGLIHAKSSHVMSKNFNYNKMKVNNIIMLLESNREKERK